MFGQAFVIVMVGEAKWFFLLIFLWTFCFVKPKLIICPRPRTVTFSITPTNPPTPTGTHTPCCSNFWLTMIITHHRQLLHSNPISPTYIIINSCVSIWWVWEVFYFFNSLEKNLTWPFSLKFLKPPLEERGCYILLKM